MIDYNLLEYMREELQRTPTDFHRYKYNQIIWEDRMIGITGPRGVGKSTMVKQRLLSQDNHSGWLYVTADHVWFANHSIFELAEQWVKEGGTHLIIDEVHRYSGWSLELKRIYDSFTQLNVIFTGSSVLDIYQGAADLSRRALMFNMQGLSFREYLDLFENIKFPVYDLESILTHKVEIPKDFHPLPMLRDYLKKGYFPFCNQPGYEIRLQQVITQTIETDIPQYANMNASTSRKLKRLLSILAESVPYKPNISRLSVELGVSKNDLPDYLVYLERGGMIGLVRDDTGGLRNLGKIEKVLIDNPNIMYALKGSAVNLGTLRETFFYNQVRAGYDITASKLTDFRIGARIFEVGGQKKGNKQLEGAPNGIVVRDDIEHGHGIFVPLWQFGLLY